MHACMYAYVGVYACTCVCIYVYMYICTCEYSSMRTCGYVGVPARIQVWEDGASTSFQIARCKIVDRLTFKPRRQCDEISTTKSNRDSEFFVLGVLIWATLVLECERRDPHEKRIATAHFGSLECDGAVLKHWIVTAIFYFGSLTTWSSKLGALLIQHLFSKAFVKEAWGPVK